MHSTVDPHDSGLLDVGGHQLYWEVSGNPTGIDALYLHGGPGDTLRGGYRTKFDPELYRIIAVQQRGAGRSTPMAGSTPQALEGNTTQQLVRDLEALRTHLGVEKWLVNGVSWGSTLALHYGVAHPDRLLGLVLVAVTATTPEEVWWVTEGVGRLYPEAWEELSGFVEAHHPTWRRGQAPLIEAVAEIMTSGDDELRAEMAVHWMAWEESHIQIGLPLDQLRPVTLCELPIAEQIAFTTLVSHYWAAHARLDERFVPPGGLMAHLDALRGVPLCMVHGRRDVSGPMRTPWQIKNALPEAELHVVEAEGHGGAVMMELWARATDSFARTGGFSQIVARR